MTPLFKRVSETGAKLLVCADELVMRVLGRDFYAQGYRNSLSHRAISLGGSPEKHADEDLRAIDSKVGPLLTHVSIMIAAIAAIISIMNMGPIKRMIFFGEIAAYLIIAIACLRCISQQAASIREVNYRSIDHNEEFVQGTIREAMIKSAWFTVANSATIGLTLLLLISTPLLLIA